MIWYKLAEAGAQMYQLNTEALSAIGLVALATLENKMRFIVLVTCCTVAAVAQELDEVYLTSQEARPRYTRQLHGSGSLNAAGGMDLNVAAPLAHGDAGTLAAVGSVSGLGKDGLGGYNRAGGGLAFSSPGGHGASVQASNIPDFGKQLTGAGKVNLMDTGAHKLDAGAFATRTFPNSNTGLPNFNTYGGNLGYNFNDKVGATLSAAHTPLFQKTDVSAMGTYNLFRDRTTSLDLTGGASRSWSPYIPKSSWQPTFGVGLTKYF